VQRQQTKCLGEGKLELDVGFVDGVHTFATSRRGIGESSFGDTDAGVAGKAAVGQRMGLRGQQMTGDGGRTG